MNKILIIEDEEVLLGVLQKKLIQEGYEVAIALDGEEGLNKMRQSKPDLILLDIVMPKKDGFEVLNEMNQDETLKVIPVVVISNSGQPVEIDRILKLGVKDYLIKAEFDIDEIVVKIKKIIGQSGVISENESDSQKKSGSESKKDRSLGETVLIIEDDKFLRELVSKKMQSKGYKIIEASDSDEAFEKLKEVKPDLILLDLILPGVHGFQILQQLKKDPKTKPIPVIILTNLGQRDEVEQGINLGAEDFLIKAHHTIEEIIDKVREVLRRQKK